MVVPSDVYCIRNGYTIEFNDFGSNKVLPDYKTALQNDSNLRGLISEMGDIMAKNGFPLIQLEQELKTIESTTAELTLISGKETGASIEESPVELLRRTAKADILLDLDYTVTQIGPKRQVGFNLTAIDAYSSKTISGNTGTGTASGSSASMPLLLQEVVLSFKDNLFDGLIRYFQDMFANGREISVSLYRFESCPVDFETEFEYNGIDAELSEIIEVWFEDNCVAGRFGSPLKSENMMKFSQVRMPLMGKSLSGKDVAIDAFGFVRNLANMLKKSPYNLVVKTVPKGLGDVWIILGEK